MSKILSPILFLCFSMFAIQASAQNSARCISPVYEIDFDGTILSGSKQQLIQVAQAGEALRVAWDLDFDGDKKSDLSHWSDAKFISVIGDNVVTQVQSIHSQSPDRKTNEITLPDKYRQWHGLLDSQGKLQSRFERSEKASSRQVRSVWCLANPEKSSWRLIYKHDVNGDVLFGDKQILINAVRAGQAIQVGWGLVRERDGVEKSIEHTVSPEFVTIVDKNEVVAQMPEHIAQKSYWNAENSLFEDGAVLWRGLATTQGRFDAIWVNRASGEVVRRSPQRAAFSWYAQGRTQSAATLAIEKGVISDKDRASEQVPYTK